MTSGATASGPVPGQREGDRDAARQRRARHRTNAFRPLVGKLDWFGTIGGRKQPQGLYRLQLSAEDPAGNLSARTKPVFVQLTYIALGRSTIRALARTRFGVRVTTDAGSFRWRFAGRTGTGEAGLLVLKAPKAGRYTLFVETNGHADKARVVVSPRPKTGRAAR